MSDTDLLLPSHHIAVNTWGGWGSWRRFNPRLCILSRAGILIILWTIFFGFVYTSICTTAAVFILSNRGHTLVGSVATYPMSIMYAGLAVVAMFYPLIGFFADVSCGRHKVVIVCFSLVLFSFLTLYICLVTYLVRSNYYHVWDVDPAVSVIGCIAILVSLIGLGGYQANFIQFGLDQLLSAPSEHLALFIHWAVWAFNLGSTAVAVIWPAYVCLRVGLMARILLTSIPFFVIVLFMLVFVISLWKRHWFNVETRHQNPCSIILKILNFARKHNHALQRSAFTFTDNEKPSRLDFAKAIYGGPFTTEQVEDTKTFFKILMVLLALGPIFTIDVPSSYLGFMLFSLHMGNAHANLYGPNEGFGNCTNWILIRSGSLKYIAGSLLFPMYMWFIFSCLRKRIPGMFVRILAGIVVYMFGNICLAVTDLIGHINFKQRTNDASLCMFHYDLQSSPTLEMHWTVVLAPSILLGVGPLIVKTTALEFISAQSPHFMKGLMVGLLFAIVGLFQLISAAALIPFSVENIWSSVAMKHNPPITHCGFGYFIFTFLVALIGIILFAVVAKKYTYRERDDRPYNQSQVEEIFSRNLETSVYGCDH